MTTKELAFDTGVECIVALAGTTVSDASVTITSITAKPSVAVVQMVNGCHCDVTDDAE